VYLVRQGCPRPAREADYDGPLMGEPQTEYDRGQWAYGVKKRALEDELQAAWEQRRFPATRLRIPMVNGERDHFRRIERYLWRMLDGGPILLPGGGARVTRHVYSGAVVKAVLGLLGREASFGRAYNLAQDETPSLRELLGTLARLVGADPRFVEATRTRCGEPGSTRCCCRLSAASGCRSSSPRSRRPSWASATSRSPPISTRSSPRSWRTRQPTAARLREARGRAAARRRLTAGHARAHDGPP
jgi:nucleoside-diphosphate-sugar epimerase